MRNLTRMTNTKYLDYKGVSARTGLTLYSTRTYLAKARKNRAEGRPRPGDMPEPDLTVGTSPAWLPETIEKWQRSRPGQGIGGGRRSAKGVKP